MGDYLAGKMKKKARHVAFYSQKYNLYVSPFVLVSTWILIRSYESLVVLSLLGDLFLQSI